MSTAAATEVGRGPIFDSGPMSTGGQCVEREDGVLIGRAAGGLAGITPGFGAIAAPAWPWLWPWGS